MPGYVGGGRRTKQAVQQADAVSRVYAGRQALPWTKPQNRARRTRLENDVAKWLAHYLANTYTRKFEEPHLEIIDGAMGANETGGRFAVAAERGIGKSSLLWGVVLYLALTGKQPFPVCIPWQESAKKRAFRFWKSALCFNEKLLADYPEICGPFAHSKGIPQKLLTITWAGGPNDGALCGGQLNMSEGLIVLPNAHGCIGGSTINGNPRGLNHPQEDGTVLRPSIVLLDDVQDRGTAKSRTQVQSVIEMIDGDVAGCGAPGRDMPILMACNCIERDDVSAHYLTNPMWRSIRISCVKTWPEGWDEEDGACHTAWDELRVRIQDDDNPTGFYKKNKRVITNGMTLSAPGAFKGAKNCPDALYGVIRMYMQMGHDAFMAERQQTPIEKSPSIHSVTTQAILEKEDPNARSGVVPEWATAVVAASDINPSYGISTVVAAVGGDQRMAVVWYGIHRTKIPSTDSEAQRKAKIMRELEVHGKKLAALPCRPNHWVIDGGGSPQETVIAFAATSPQTTGLEAVCAYGRAWRQFRPKVKDRKFEQVFVRQESRSKRWAIWNVDYWKEIAQMAWIAATGAPGSCSLFRGSHREFADQICRETLAGKAETAGTWVYVWNTKAGPHDYGDCMAMLFACAAILGIGTGGQQKIRKKKRIAAVIGGKRVGG